MFFDSHCHLTDAKLLPQLDGVLERARAADVSAMLSIATDLEDAARTLQLCDDQTIWASAGVHPASALTWDDDSARALIELARDSRVLAIGEIGLDYRYDDSHPDYPGATRARQAEVFEAQLQIAADLQLPIVIHNREADDDLLAIVEAWQDRLRGGVFHCFGGSPAVARRVLDLEFHLGFTGIVLVQKSSGNPSCRAFVSARAECSSKPTRLIWRPCRCAAKPNEPSFVPFVADKIAELKGMSREEIGEITTANARRLFRIND